MFRFTMPEATLPISEQVTQLRAQGRAFLESEALQNLLSLLNTNRNTIAQTYNGRLSPGGQVRETQELGCSAHLESCRDELYPLIEELGFLGINEPLREDNDRVLVLGGSLNACQCRTEYARNWLSPSTQSVDGLACFRPLNPAEREQAKRPTSNDTEFGALSECFVSTFKLSRESAFDDFHGDRNLNGISCVRTFSGAHTGRRTYRMFAAPSTQPGVRRADTGDSIAFYLQHTTTSPSDSLLAITDNRHCNRQFLQIAYQLMKLECPMQLDVIGCTGNDRIPTREHYEPFQFIQDLIGVLDWIDRIDKLA